MQLPAPNDEKLILVPKSIVRIRSEFDVGKYYRHYVLTAMQDEEIHKNSGLVNTIKSGKNKGTKKVFKTDLQKKYGTEEKAVSISYTDQNPEILERHKADNSEPTPALSHRQIAEAQDSAPPDWALLLSNVTTIEPGRKGAYKYEDAITDLLTALFYPVLVDPQKQTPLHDGLKRVDLTFTNYARSGFFEWLSRHYSCSHVFIECKNFGEELGNPEIDQIAMRFSKERGQFGIVVCRNLENANRLEDRCKAAARDGHGFVVCLTDDELGKLIEEAQDHLLQRHEFPSLKSKFDKLIF